MVSPEDVKKLFESLGRYPRSIPEAQRLIRERFGVELSREETKKLLIEARYATPLNYLPRSREIPTDWIRKAKTVTQNEFGYVVEVTLKDGSKKKFTVGADRLLTREEIERRAREGWKKKQEEYLRKKGIKLPDIVKVRLLDVYCSLEVDI